MNIIFKCIWFDDLKPIELHDLLALRNEVFIVEQNCLYQDIDGNDPKAWHCLGYDDHGTLIACTRLFAKNDYYEGYTSIGRVVGSPRCRGQNVGRQLMQYSIKTCNELFGNEPIKIGAQQYLTRFYESFGFVQTGQDYIEDGIPHTYMTLK